MSQQFAKYSGHLWRLGKLQKQWIVQSKPKRVPQLRRIRSWLPHHIPIGDVRSLAGNDSVNLIGYRRDLRFGEHPVEKQVSVLFKPGCGLRNSVVCDHKLCRLSEYLTLGPVCASEGAYIQGSGPAATARR